MYSAIQEIHDQPLEHLTFQPSPDVTLGVELELQILDPQTSDLAPGALRILGGCEDAGIANVGQEFLLSMIEVKTPVCHGVGEVQDHVYSVLRRVHNIAQSMGYDLAMGATHPFARGTMSAIFPDERYQRIHRQQGWQAYQESLFGMHVHVGVPGGDEAIGLINLLSQYLPHLVALSANSPFWEGVDTGYASSRVRLFRPGAQCGVPLPFENWDGFTHYCEVMHRAGALDGTKDLYWDIRPRPQIGTIEFRICDMPSSLHTVFGLTALIHSLVVEGLSVLRDQRALRPASQETFWLATENRWRAARYGMQTLCLRQLAEEPRRLEDDVADLLERLLPVAQDLGERDYFSALLPANQESGAERQRRIFRQTGDWKAVIGDIQSRWLLELDEGVSCHDVSQVASIPVNGNGQATRPHVIRPQAS